MAGEKEELYSETLPGLTRVRGPEALVQPWALSCALELWPPPCPCLWPRKLLFREGKGFTHFGRLAVTGQELDPGQGSQVRDGRHTPAVPCAPSQGTNDGTPFLATSHHSFISLNL